MTERPGRLRHVDANGKVGAPITGVPAVFAQGQGGLLDVVLAPDYATSKRIYLSYAEPGDDGNAGTAVAMATWTASIAAFAGIAAALSRALVAPALP